jgi:hypothetical protein
MACGSKPFPSNGFALDARAAGDAAPVVGSAGDERKTVVSVVEPESTQPVAFPRASAATPPSTAQATATAANGPVRTAVEL